MLFEVRGQIFGATHIPFAQLEARAAERGGEGGALEHCSAPW
ncbi:hypothetical protein [Gemmatimonas sp.]